MNTHKNDAAAFMERFSCAMDQHFADILSQGQDIAVGVSGGPDSMALCYALSELVGWKFKIHAITVDHRLREDSTSEAQHVSEALRGLPNVEHVILHWDYSEKPDSRIQERARKARYDVMSEHMKERAISHLFTAHHMDDQAETFLFRLSKGSGLDGLSAMPFRRALRGGELCRPFLDFSKQDILDFCAAKKIQYVNDPSNQSEVFARVRLRRSMDVLAEEGLSSKRLSVTAKRMSRAREALEYYAQRTFEDGVLNKDSDRIVFSLNALSDKPFDTIVRVVNTGLEALQDGDGKQYGVRMEKLEALCEDFLKPNTFRKRTLGKVIFERDNKKGEFIMSREHS